MLTAMRKSVGSTFVKIFIFGILILSFGMFGISDYVFSGTDLGPVAVVGNQEITIAQLTNSYRRDLQRLNVSSIDPEQAQALGLARQTLQRLVSQSVLDQEADALKLTATDNQVRARLRADPTFQGAGGDFDPDRYRAVLRATGNTSTSYEARLRQESARSQLAQGLLRGVAAPGIFVKSLISYRQETRVADYLTVPVRQDRKIADPGEATLTGYFDSVKDEFRQPEFRALAYLYLSAENLAGTIEIDEAELRQIYQDRIVEFTVPAIRSYRQMLFEDEIDAGKAVERLRAGEDFESVASDMLGEDDIANLSFGPVGRTDVPDATMAAAIFDADPDGIQPPVKGAFGWTVVEITSAEGGAVQSFDDLEPRLRDEQALNVAIELVYSLSQDLFDQIGGGATLEETSDSLNLPLRKVEAVDRNGLDLNGKRVDLPAEVEFLTIAFETAAGQDSFITETADNGYFVLRVERVTESRVPDLADIRQRVVEAWKSEQRRDAASALAEDLAERIRAGETMSKAASSAGVVWATSGEVARDLRSTGGLQRDTATELFSLKTGEVSVIESNDSLVVARLNSIGRGRPDFDVNEALAEQLRAGMALDILDQLGDALERRYSVDIRQDAIDQVYFPTNRTGAVSHDGDVH